MTKLFLLTPSVALTACAATVAPVPAGSQAMPVAAIADASCGASNYRYLVGRPVPDSREITDREYRLALGTVAATRANRVTLIYDGQSQRITEVRCG